ncbi:hypothetical protein [Streptomyces sp. SAS_267]
MTQVSETIITWASITLMTCRLTRKPPWRSAPASIAMAVMAAAA